MHDRLLQFLNCSGVVEPIDRGNNPNAEFYRLRNGTDDWFIRLEKNRVREPGDAIARWLKGRGASVNAPLDGYPKDFGDGWFITVYPYLETRPTGPEDMGQLGRALRKLHNTLQQHPNLPQWRNTTDKYLLALSSIRAKLASGQLQASPYADGLRDLARDENNDFAVHGAPRIACHMGEARVDIHSGAIVFFNFKNVSHAVMPAAFELARIVERDIILPKHDLNAARELLKAYGVDGKLHLARIMSANILRACCALATTKAGPAQWQQIFDLYEIIRRNTPAVDALEA